MALSKLGMHSAFPLHINLPIHTLMTAATASVTLFDTVKFWRFYDEFIQSNLRDKNLNAQLAYLVRTHINEIFKLDRTEKGWGSIRAWIALEDKQLYSPHGDPGVFIFTGDVVLIDKGYDRDIIVTHDPIREFVSGPLLGHEQSHGLFLPLFEGSMTQKAIEIRLEEGNKRAFERFRKERMNWWY